MTDNATTPQGEALDVFSSSFVPREGAPQDTSKVETSQSTSTKLTSSDKLTALPTAISSPMLDRFRNASLSQTARHSFERSASGSSDRGTPPPVARAPSQVSQKGARPSEESIPKERGRVSFESENHSVPNLRRHHTSITTRLGLTSESNPDVGSPKLLSSPEMKPSKSFSRTSSSDRGSPGPSVSRGASPLRFIPALLHRAHSRDEPFVPVDPFRVHWHLRHRRSSSEEGAVHPANILCAPCILANHCCECFHEDSFVGLAHALTDTFPRQTYLHLLLRLPSLYWGRVCRIFEDAELSRSDMRRMVAATQVEDVTSTLPDQATGNGHANAARLAPPLTSRPAAGRRSSAREHWSRLLPAPEEWVPPNVSPAMARFKISWSEFIDSLIKEWKTLNIVSALLLSSILTLFQVPDAASDPAARTPALLSLICAVVSLSFGVLYIVRFGTMRSMYKATRWAAAAQRTRTSVWWNVWVMLALPAVWLAWAMLFFLTAIMAFVWRTGAVGDEANHDYQLSQGQMLPIRIVISALLALAGVYLVAIIQTFRAYGSGDAYAGVDPGSRPMSRSPPIALVPIPATPRREPTTSAPGPTPEMRREASERGRGRPTRARERRVEPSVGLGLVGVSDAPPPPGARSLADVDVEKGDLIPGLARSS